MTPGARPPLCIHASNVHGLGATAVVEALLPELERLWPFAEVHLPATGRLARFRPADLSAALRLHRRRLPKPLSRALECLLWRPLGGRHPAVLVLGDQPLRLRQDQFVLVHTPHLVAPLSGYPPRERLRLAVAQGLFRLNAGRVTRFVVQSEAMRRLLASHHGIEADRILVVPPPAPPPVARPRRDPATRPRGPVLLFPASGYPHKNHAVLGALHRRIGDAAPFDRIVVTARGGLTSDPPWIEDVGLLTPEEVWRAYAQADALLFPSLAETVGLPLLEAMAAGLPIVAADLPYARDICGDGAIYFDPHDPGSLQVALLRFRELWEAGWTPDWSARLTRFPSSWAEHAQALLSGFAAAAPAAGAARG